MENILGFTTINVYALILILFVCGEFFSKKRLHETEDNTYPYLLVATILTTLFCILLGLIVVPEYNVSEIVISLSNKFYLVCLETWTLLLTFYTFYISRIKEGRPVKEIRHFFIMGILIAALIFILPLDTQVNNGIAEATGPSLVFTYTSLALEFLTIFILYFHSIRPW